MQLLTNCLIMRYPITRLILIMSIFTLSLCCILKVYDVRLKEPLGIVVIQKKKKKPGLSPIDIPLVSHRSDSSFFSGSPINFSKKRTRNRTWLWKAVSEPEEFTIKTV